MLIFIKMPTRWKCKNGSILFWSRSSEHDPILINGSALGVWPVDKRQHDKSDSSKKVTTPYRFDRRMMCSSRIDRQSICSYPSDA